LEAEGVPGMDAKGDGEFLKLVEDVAILVPYLDLLKAPTKKLYDGIATNSKSVPRSLVNTVISDLSRTCCDLLWPEVCKPFIRRQGLWGRQFHRHRLLSLEGMGFFCTTTMWLFYLESRSII
jgi:hypothetical protein